MQALLIPFAIAGVVTAAAWKLIASGAEDAGQAINQTGSGVIKIAIAGAIGYAGVNYMKGLKLWEK